MAVPLEEWLGLIEREYVHDFVVAGGSVIKFAVGNREEIIQQLAANEIDLVIMGRPPRELETVAAPFAKHPLVLIASPTHPLATKRRIRLCWTSGVRHGLDLHAPAADLVLAFDSEADRDRFARSIEAGKRKFPISLCSPAALPRAHAAPASPWLASSAAGAT